MKKLLAIALVSSLLACNHDEDAKTNTEVELIDVQGVWHGICRATSDNSIDNPEFRKEILTFTADNKMSFSSKNYLDSGCLDDYAQDNPHPNEDLSEKSGTFLVGQSLTTDSGLSAKELDMTFLLDEGESVNETSYTIVSTLEGKLTFGKGTTEKNGSTAEKRPTALNFDNYFTKE